MAKFENISLSGDKLRDYSLTFRKIYYNQTVFEREEAKLFYHNNRLQGNIYGMSASTRSISKTLDKKLFNDDNKK